MHQRIYYFDFLNIIACIAVIALHHNGIVHTFTPTHHWNQALFVEVICYWAVPIFFMLSGATLMDYRKRYSTKKFFIQRIKRTLIPFIFWSIVAGTIHCYINKEIPTFHLYIYKIFNTEFQNVYWFFLPLFGIYLLTPILNLLKDKRDILIYLLIIISLQEGILMPLYKLLEVEPIGRNSISGPILFFILGYLLSTTTKQINKKVLIIVSIFCLILRYIVTYKFSYINNETYKLLFGYYYFTSIIPAITIFVYVKDKFPTKNKESINNILKNVSSYSFGVYLIHMYIILIELKILNNISLENTWWGFRTFMVLITYITCVIIVHIIKKSRIGKFILP